MNSRTEIKETIQDLTIIEALVLMYIMDNEPCSIVDVSNGIRNDVKLSRSELVEVIAKLQSLNLICEGQAQKLYANPELLGYVGDIIERIKSR